MYTNARQVLKSDTDRSSKKSTSVYMVESVYIRDKFATKEENIKQVVNSQLGQIDTKVKELGTRIDDHGIQRIRNVGRPIAPSDQGCQFGFFDAKLDKFGFFSRPLASKILFGFLAFFPSEFGFFSEAIDLSNNYLSLRYFCAKLQHF